MKRHSHSLRAEVRARLAAGETDAEALWRRLEAENPSRHIPWSYVCRLAREWQRERADLCLLTHGDKSKE